MRIAISNIAWDTAEDDAVAMLLNQNGVDAIDVAPPKYFPDPARAREEDVLRVRRWWADRHIEVTGMQALLFGTTGLNLFGSPESQDAMLAHLDAICRIAAQLGGPRLVFGSPKNRDRTGLTDYEAQAIAVPFFRRLGDIAARHEVWICLEPNPPCYGCNFMTGAEDTAGIVRAVSHPAIRMQLDTGALIINGEDPEVVLMHHAELIGHIHASEPELAPLGDANTAHAAMAAAVAKWLPTHIVSIEMLAARNEPHPVAIERALGVAIRHYRPQTGPGGVA